MPFLYSIIYILCIGVLTFIIGRLLPRKWLNPSRFPFRSFAFEEDGKIYNKIKIMSWKTKLPDLSMIIAGVMPWLLPKKRLDNESRISVLIEETCIAEISHALCGVLGFGCIFIMEGIGGLVISLLCLFVNSIFIIIQRFNRPRLIKADLMLRRRGEYKTGEQGDSFSKDSPIS